MGTTIAPWFEREAIDLEMTWKANFLTGVAVAAESH